MTWLPAQFVNNITISKHTMMDVAGVVYAWTWVIILVAVVFLFSEARKKVKIFMTDKSRVFFEIPMYKC